MPVDKILVIGSEGQIGTVLSHALRQIHGIAHVVTSDINPPRNSVIGYFEKLNILDGAKLHEIVKKHKITQIYHLAALLSAKGEQNPRQTWDVNMNGLFNVLEVARQEKIDKVFFPSSIAVFGGLSSKINTPQHGILQPQTMYGITKEVGEHLAEYYFNKFGLDVRSIRYPGLISCTHTRPPTYTHTHAHRRTRSCTHAHTRTQPHLHHVQAVVELGYYLSCHHLPHTNTHNHPVTIYRLPWSWGLSHPPSPSSERKTRMRYLQETNQP